MSAWGVLHVRPGRQGAAALTSLETMAIETFHPRWKLTWSHHGHQYERLIPLFMNYVLVKFDLSDPRLWHEVMSLPGVRGIIGGGTPTQVRDEEVLRVREWVRDSASVTPRSLARFREGERVNLSGGVTGSFISGDGTIAVVKIALLGREFVLQVPEALCDPAASDGLGLRSGWHHNRRRHRRLGGRASRDRGTVPIVSTLN